MSGDARYHRAKADGLLTELPGWPGSSPVTTIHLSYYAMWHAATAALLHRNGSVSRNHGRLIAAFKALIASEPETASGVSPDALDRAYELRCRADYEAGVPPEDMVEHAREIGDLRASVLAFCDRVLADP